MYFQPLHLLCFFAVPLFLLNLFPLSLFSLIYFESQFMFPFLFNFSFFRHMSESVFTILSSWWRGTPDMATVPTSSGPRKRRRRPSRSGRSSTVPAKICVKRHPRRSKRTKPSLKVCTSLNAPYTWGTKSAQNSHFTNNSQIYWVLGTFKTSSVRL